MSLPPGTRLGPHQIFVPLGAGGAGEDYLAKAPSSGSDVERVCPGATIQSARQIADALEAGHQKGLIHRDLKPASVMGASSNTTRRSFTMLASGLLAGCSRLRTEAASGALLQARPGDVATPCEPGTHPLKLRAQRDSLLYVPKSAAADKPAPLVLYLHGATGNEQQGIRRFSTLADESGFLLLSPASEDQTWDAIRDGYGPDVRLIDRALAAAFGMRRVDPARIAVAGFSDGASYALGLGLANGDLLRTVLAFSPCFVPPGAARQGKPRIFASHGTDDSILPIASCSHRLVPELKRGGYEVNYREFEGPHTVPPDIAREAVRWFCQRKIESS